MTCPSATILQNNDPGTNVATVTWAFSFNDNSLVENEPGITNDSFTITLKINGQYVNTDLPKLLGIGSSTVEYNVTDNAGNSVQCLFLVTVAGKAIRIKKLHLIPVSGNRYSSLFQTLACSLVRYCFLYGMIFNTVQGI